MKSRIYKVIIEPDEPKGFHAWVPALRGCHSAGMTVAEAKRNIREAIDLYMESLEARGLPIPRESTRSARMCGRGDYTRERKQILQGVTLRKLKAALLK